MNLIHRWLCNSARWRKAVETYILPWTLEGLNLGSDVLEVGPGPGASTDLLHARVARLTCVETDHGFAEKLRRPCYLSCAAKSCGFRRSSSRCNETVCFSIPREEVNRGCLRSK
jgi:ribosomal RNA adenine dimethylase